MKTKLIKIMGVWINPSNVIAVKEGLSGHSCEVYMLGCEKPLTFSCLADQFVEAIHLERQL